MSCNGCRVLRKGCSDSCILRPCLQWIESPESQGHATVFVAKFFGRAGLMSFISAVSENQRPALFQSLLFEACGRTVNPINGAVGLLWTGNWHVCQRAVETVLRGGSLRPVTDSFGGIRVPESDEASEVEVSRDPYFRSKASSSMKRKGFMNEVVKLEPSDLNLSLTGVIPSKVSKVGPVLFHHRPEKRRPTTPSMTSDQESVTTSESIAGDHSRGNGERKLLSLFV